MWYGSSPRGTPVLRVSIVAISWNGVHAVQSAVTRDTGPKNHHFERCCILQAARNPRKPTKKTHTIATTHVPIPLAEASSPMGYHTTYGPRSLSGLLYRVSMSLGTIECYPDCFKQASNCCALWMANHHAILAMVIRNYMFNTQVVNTLYG